MPVYYRILSRHNKSISCYSLFFFLSLFGLWVGGGGLSAAQSLKCKLIFYVIFQYIFYSLNLFENVCGLFYQTILYSQSAAFWSP